MKRKLNLDETKSSLSRSNVYYTNQDTKNRNHDIQFVHDQRMHNDASFNTQSSSIGPSNNYPSTFNQKLKNRSMNQGNQNNYGTLDNQSIPGYQGNLGITGIPRNDSFRSTFHNPIRSSIQNMDGTSKQNSKPLLHNDGANERDQGTFSSQSTISSPFERMFGYESEEEKNTFKFPMENDMNYLQQFQNMRLVLGRLFQDSAQVKNKEGEFILNSVLSKDPLFAHEKYLLSDIEESISIVLNADLKEGNQESHQFCQTMESFMDAVRKQKDKLVNELLEIEKNAVQTLVKEGPDFIMRPSVMCQYEEKTSNDNCGTLEFYSKKESSAYQGMEKENVESFKSYENPQIVDFSRYNSKRGPELLSEMNVRNHLNSIYGRLKFLHSLVRRTREKYLVLINSSTIVTPSSVASSPSTTSESPKSFRSFPGVTVPNCQLSTFILNTIFGELCYHEPFRTCDTTKPIIAMLLEIFIEVITPYLGFLDNWLFNGDISKDYSQEFIIVRNSNINSIKGTSEYWSKFFEIRDVKQVPDFLCSSIGNNSLINEILLTGKSIHLMQFIEKENLLYKNENLHETPAKNFLDSSTRSGDKIDEEEIFFFDTDRPTLQSAFFALLQKYTSKEMLSKIGSLEDEVTTYYNNNNNISNIDDDVMESYFHSPTSPKVPVGSFRYSSPRSQSPKRRKIQSNGIVLDFGVEREENEFDNESKALENLFDRFIQPKELEINNSSIARNLFSFSQDIDGSSMIKSFDNEPIQELVQELSMPTLFQYLNASQKEHFDREKLQLDVVSDTFIPFNRLLELALYAPIHEQYLKVSPYVVGLLFRHCRLLDHFLALRSIYFMESGDIMHFFCTQLFDLELRSKEFLYEMNQLDLNSILQEALQFGVVHARSYSFNDDNNAKFSNLLGNDESINIFETIRVQDRLKIIVKNNTELNSDHNNWALHYEAEYPLNAIISSDSIEKYNMILKLLLEISQAKYLLDRIRLPNDSLSLKSAHLLLFQMRQFVNTLHQYIKTRVVEECWNEFLEAISKATDLDAIIQSHDNYLSNVLQRCLLKGPPPIFLNEIRHILVLSVSFYEKCASFNKHYTTQTLTFQELDERENLFKRLNNGVTRTASEFESHVRTLAGLLNRILKRGLHPELKDLEMRLDFNSFYSSFQENG